MYEFGSNAAKAVWHGVGLPPFTAIPDPLATGTAADGQVLVDGARSFRVQPPAEARGLVPVDVSGAPWPTVPRQPVRGAGIVGNFLVSKVPEHGVFAAQVASGVDGSDLGTEFVVTVTSLDGAVPEVEVASVALDGGAAGELRGDLSAFAGRAVNVALLTRSRPLRLQRRPRFAGRRCRTGNWSNVRLGTRAEIDARTFRYELTSVTINAAGAEPSGQPPKPGEVGGEHPALTVMPYAVDGAGVSEALGASTPRPAELVTGAMAGPLAVHKWLTIGVGQIPLPIGPGDHLTFWPFPFWTVMHVSPMEGGDPNAAFHGVVIVATEVDQGGSDAIANEVFQRFKAEANALLQSTLPVGGPATGLTAAQSVSLQDAFDAIATGLESKVVAPGGLGDADDLVGIGHASWGIGVPYGSDLIDLDRTTGSLGSDYTVTVSVGAW